MGGGGGPTNSLEHGAEGAEEESAARAPPQAPLTHAPLTVQTHAGPRRSPTTRAAALSPPRLTRPSTALGRPGRGEGGQPTGDAKLVEAIAGATKLEAIAGATEMDSIAGTTKMDSIAGATKMDAIAGTTKMDAVAGATEMDAIAGISKMDSIAGSTEMDAIAGAISLLRPLPSRVSSLEQKGPGLGCTCACREPGRDKKGNTGYNIVPCC